MKLSHSAIPTFSPALTVDGAAALRFVGAPQASTSSPIRTHTIKRRDLDIFGPPFVKKSGDNIHFFTNLSPTTLDRQGDYPDEEQSIPSPASVVLSSSASPGPNHTGSTPSKTQ